MLKKFNDTFLRNYQKCTIIAKNNSDTLVGGVYGYSRSGVMFIEYLVVDQKYRIRGIGEELLKGIEEIAKKQKCKTIFLDTFNAQKFYENRGYTTFNIIDFYEDGKKQCFMKKILS